MHRAPQFLKRDHPTALKISSVAYATDHPAMGVFNCGYCDSVGGSAMTRRPSDDEIEMEKRRTREVELCVTAQEEIVVRLDLIGVDNLAVHGRDLLARFHEFLAMERARLVGLEEKCSATAPQSNQDATDDIRRSADFAEELSR